WQAILPEIVGRRQLHDAVALNSIGFNLARAVGPAVGGLVVSLAGPSPAFFLNAASFLATIGAIAWWRPAASTPTGVAESLLGATRAGLRYARFAPALVAVLVRTGVYVLFASALWALLPLVVQRELHAESSSYGLLMATLGIGAVGGAAVLPALRASFSVDQRVAGATAVFAAASAALGYVPLLW